MSIDWITVSAQIVNFLILVWLLKRLLYQPVLNAMARREERIVNSQNEADERASSAEDQRREFFEKTQQLEKQRDELLAQAREAAQSEHRELLETARGEVAESRTAWLQQLQNEKGDFLEQLAGWFIVRVLRD
jgi:F-type H+-transporting ATPase subunit b